MKYLTTLLTLAITSTLGNAQVSGGGGTGSGSAIPNYPGIFDPSGGMTDVVFGENIVFVAGPAGAVGAADSGTPLIISTPNSATPTGIPWNVETIDETILNIPSDYFDDQDPPGSLDDFICASSAGEDEFSNGFNEFMNEVEDLKISIGTPPPSSLPAGIATDLDDAVGGLFDMTSEYFAGMLCYVHERNPTASWSGSPGCVQCGLHAPVPYSEPGPTYAEAPELHLIMKTYERRLAAANWNLWVDLNNGLDTENFTDPDYLVGVAISYEYLINLANFDLRVDIQEYLLTP